jgi:hypothetical protein
MHSPALSPTTARTTGLLYLAMAVVAVPGFLVIRPLLFDPDSPASTLAHLVQNESLARGGIALELALVAVQTLTALWFFRLFRHVDLFQAVSVAVFGILNAVAILGSAAGLGASLDAALAGDAAGAQLMHVLSSHLWGVGALFFGLWLVPMGLLALRAGLPRALGWALLVGGAAYVTSTFVGYLAPDASALAEGLTYLATVGEFWMIGILLWRGFRRGGSPIPPAPADTELTPVTTR